MALLAAATGDQAALEQRLGLIEQRMADGQFAAGPVVPRIVRALNAFAVAMTGPASANSNRC